MVEQFAKQVAVPPDTEIHGQVFSVDDQRVVVLWVVRIIGR